VDVPSLLGHVYGIHRNSGWIGIHLSQPECLASETFPHLRESAMAMTVHETKTLCIGQKTHSYGVGADGQVLLLHD